ncbi:MAG: hypothetical protein KL787_02990 [Taibaiella sp.]|nr:hypothetical protein [Taibaiella sp.]
MPANKKHLTHSPLQRFLKITAAILGGYLVTNSVILLSLHYLDKRNILVTMKFLAYMIWVTLMVFAFLSKNGWKIWGIYLLLTILISAPLIIEKIF